MRKSLLGVCAVTCTSLGLVVSFAGEAVAASSQTQIIELKQGISNVVGLYVKPDNPDLTAVLGDISEYVTYVQDEKGLSWRPINGKIINAIGDIIPGRGYIIKVSEDVSLTVTGPVIDPAEPVIFTKGYNLFMFLNDAPLDPQTVFAPLSPDFSFLQDLGRNTCSFNDGTWVNEVGDLTQDNIYLVKMSEEREVAFAYTISTEAAGNGVISESATANVGSSYTVTATPDSGYAVSSLFVDGKSVTPQKTYTFENLDRAHSVRVVFAADPTLFIPDTDGDGLNDKLEKMLGLDPDSASDVADLRSLPFSFDSDGDGLTDLYEKLKGTDSKDVHDTAATDFTVDPSRGEDPAQNIYTTVSAAVAAAADYDIITVAPGTYDESIEISGKSLLIRAQSKVHRSIVKGLKLNDTKYGSIIDGFVFSTSSDVAETTLNNDSSLIVNCLWEDNTGTVTLVDSSNEFRNCIFRGNFLENSLKNSDPLFSHCTFVNNAVPGTLFNYSWDTTVSEKKAFTLTNSIVYGNIMSSVGSDCTVSYSYIQGGAAGNGNIDGDTAPHVPVNRFGFPLAGSPAIDAGSADTKVVYDHFDSAASGIRDMGAVEFIDSDKDGVCDAQERAEGTDPNDSQAFRDFNFDGTPDALQLLPGNTKTTVDSDLDGLTDTEETALHSNPNKKDSDGDGLSDGWEVFAHLNYLDPGNAAADTDGDGLSDLREFTLGTNPQATDTDRDAMPDGWEVTGTLNPLQNDAPADRDTDTYSNIIEYMLDTTPQTPADPTALALTIN